MKSSRVPKSARQRWAKIVHPTLAGRSRQPQKPPRSLREFATDCYPSFTWYPHLEHLADRLEAVVRGDVKRLMVFMPPRHGKSLLASRIFPAYYLRYHPDRWYGLCSYSADIAYQFSRSARAYYYAGPGSRQADTRAVSTWETGYGGGLWAAGVGGSITGKGGHCLTIDDPLRNAEDAASRAIRNKQKDWYSSTFYTRLEPGGALVLIQTRWNEDDLSGWQLAEEAAEPECWEIVNLPAIAEAEPQQFPASCRVIKDWRSPGEPLCPERYPDAELRKIQRKIHPYFWSALYQQRPIPIDGGLIDRRWLRYYATPPTGGQVVVSVDTALKGKEVNDPWAATVWRIVGSEFYLLYVLRKRMEYPKGKAAIADLLLQWQPGTTLIEDKGSGTTLIQELRQGIQTDSGLRYFSIKAIAPTTDKLTRFSVQSGSFQSGRVLLPQAAGWLAEYEAELLGFPTGTAHDDQVDSTSQFLTWANRSNFLPPTGRTRSFF